MKTLRLFKTILVVNKIPKCHRRNTGNLSSVEEDASSFNDLPLHFHFIILMRCVRIKWCSCSNIALNERQQWKWHTANTLPVATDEITATAALLHENSNTQACDISSEICKHLWSYVHASYSGPSIHQVFTVMKTQNKATFSDRSSQIYIGFKFHVGVGTAQLSTDSESLLLLRSFVWEEATNFWQSVFSVETAGWKVKTVQPSFVSRYQDTRQSGCLLASRTKERLDLVVSTIKFVLSRHFTPVK